MLRTIVDVHILQTVPPSNINRDDTGSPKTAIYGGTRRSRVSSQAWKRATRDAFDAHLDRSELGMRTKRVVELLRDAISKQDAELSTEQATELATKTLAAVDIKLKPARKKGEPEESGYLLFLSNAQITALAELSVTSARNGAAVDKKEAKARARREHSVDVALFGRMVADDTDLNVDAAVQVAHALSVHEVSNEYDYYTAVDDHKKDDAEEDAGAGMIGTVEFNSSTLYRYATVDVDRLRHNLGDDKATGRALDAFLQSFITSMPTGKKNTFANGTLPDAILLVVRQTQSINLVGAFEEAITARENSGRVATAVLSLANYGREVHEAYNEIPVAAWSVGIGERSAALDELGRRTNLADAVSQLGEVVAQRLDGSQ